MINLIKDKIANALKNRELPKDISINNTSILTVKKFKKHYSVSFAGDLIMRIQMDYCEVKPEYKIILEKLNSDYKLNANGWLVINFNKPSLIDDFGPSFVEILKYEISNTHGEIYGCCSRYLECSNNKECVNPNFLISLGCCYRINLINNRIFYGVNRNN